MMKEVATHSRIAAWRIRGQRGLAGQARGAADSDRTQAMARALRWRADELPRGCAFLGRVRLRRWEVGACSLPELSQ